MFIDLIKLPSSMNNMAGSALKRISAAVGYYMTCSIQEDVKKQLPEGEHVDQKSIRSRLVSDHLPGKKPHKPINNTQNRCMSAREGQNPVNLDHNEIRRKIREARAQKKSWRPDRILKYRLAQMSPEEREELAQTVESYLIYGATTACDWLTWNIPKYGIRAFYLMLSGEVPEYAADAMKACDLIRNMDRQ